MKKRAVYAGSARLYENLLKHEASPELRKRLYNEKSLREYDFAFFDRSISGESRKSGLHLQMPLCGDERIGEYEPFYLPGAGAGKRRFDNF